MARVYWAVICEKAILDADTNRLSVISVIEFGTIVKDTPDEPIDALDLNLQLVFVWGRSQVDTPEVVQSRIGLQHPDGTKGDYSEPQEINLVDIGYLRHTVDLNKIGFHGPGIYEFLIESQDPGASEWKELARVPIALAVEAAPPASDSPPVA